MKKQSKFFRLELNDFWKGLLISVFTAIITAVGDLIQKDGSIEELNYKVIMFAGLAAGIAYIKKNLFTNSEGKILKGEGKNK